VVVSGRDVAVGSVLWPSDVRVVQMSDSLCPAGILSSAQSVDGHVLAGAARTGEPITDARLAGASRHSRREWALHSRCAHPARRPGVAALLRPGMRVDVVTAGAADGSRQLGAESATVVTVVAGEAEARHGPRGSATGLLVLFELTSAVATEVAAVSLVRPVTVTLR
jgi:Flp pilus assembly protein CpaB